MKPHTERACSVPLTKWLCVVIDVAVSFVLALQSVTLGDRMAVEANGGSKTRLERRGLPTFRWGREGGRLWNGRLC